LPLSAPDVLSKTVNDSFGERGGATPYISLVNSASNSGRRDVRHRAAVTLVPFSMTSGSGRGADVSVWAARKAVPKVQTAISES